MRRWTKQWEATRDRDRPGLDALAARLAETVPGRRSGRASSTATTGWTTACSTPTTPGRIKAVLDWEMSTLGDPLTDLGMMFVYWPEAGEERASTLSPVTTLPGFPTRLEVAERYAAAHRAPTCRTSTGTSASPSSSSPSIIAGIVARSAAGAMAGQGHSGYAERIDPCVELGRAALDDGAI